MQNLSQRSIEFLMMRLLTAFDVGSIIYPKYITAESIIKYVRAMKNSIGSNIETLYRLNDNRVEALELLIKEDSPMVGKPLSELRLNLMY